MDFSKLKMLMDSFTSWRIPGCACMVYKDHTPIFKYSSGFSDVKAGIDMDVDKDTMFMYSCSKPITVTAAMILYEKGKFELNEGIDKYIPEFHDLYIQCEDGTVKRATNYITIGNLFEMTAGLDYNTDKEHFKKAKELQKPHCNTIDMIKEYAKDPILFEPGEKWCYGMSHDVIGALVEVISGKSLRDFADENIFKPLNMDSTSYGYPLKSKLRFAKQYEFDDNTESYKEIETNNYFLFGDEYFSGGAGVISTVPDMAIFSDMLTCGGISKDGVRILSPHTVKLIHTNRLTKKQREEFNWSALNGYGYGLGVRTLLYPPIAGAPSPIGEFGWSGAAGAYMLCDPVNKISMFYAHHMLNNQEYYTNPRLRNVLYACLD